jgi:cytochrome c
VRRVRAALFCCAVGLAASLLLAHVHPFGDAGFYSRGGLEAPLLKNGEVPDAVRVMLAEKCADCHSNEPRVPLYGQLAPVSWLMERDIVNARGAMNLSVWDGYSVAQQQIFAAKMEQQMKSRQMPPLQYRMIHWNARIVDADLKTLTQWVRVSQAAQNGDMVAGNGDPARGEVQFEKRCTGCHALTRNHEGPQLEGVYGRTCGAVAGFAYSAALKKARIVWDQTSLEKWLTDPDAFIPGNDMDFLVSKPQERRDLISYLKQISGE